ncbi:unnamed protein product [Rhodiola kirilowii]
MAVPPNKFPISLPQEQQSQLQNQPAVQSHRTDSVERFCNQFGVQLQQLRYFPPWMVPELKGALADESYGECNLQFGFGAEPKKRKLEVQDFFENDLQNPSLDVLHPLSVSTGLGLSLDNAQMTFFSGLLSLLGEDISKELSEQDAEIDRFFKVQADRLKQSVVLKVQEQQKKICSLVINKIVNKLQEKDSELRTINQKNMVLEEKIQQVNMKVDIWKQKAAYNENIINSYMHNLQNLHAHNGANKEGFGDSEIDDTAASCFNNRATDLQLLSNDNNNVMQESTLCKGCGLKEVCMLLIPCNHLCLCKVCESTVGFCPMCHTSKSAGIEVYM